MNTGKDLLTEHIGELFQHSTTILYVGASPLRFDLKEPLTGHKIVLLERFYKNCQYFRHDKSLEWIVYGDVKDIWDYQIPIPIDVCIWWHGPEHVRSGEFADTIMNLEIITKSLVVLASPWGNCPQGDMYGNPFERHLSTLYPRDYERLDYQVATCGEEDKPPRSDIVAWKWVGGRWWK